jgi:hypothetical protein
MGENDLEIDRIIVDVTNDLAEEFGHVVPLETVRQTVTQSFSSFSGSRIQSYVPVLARRQARQHLRRYSSAR